MKKKDMTVNEFADESGIPAKRIRRFGDGAEEMKRAEYKTLMEYMFPTPKPKPTQVPHPVMVSPPAIDKPVDRTEYRNLRVLQWLTVQFIEAEDINDKDFSELVSAHSGQKISHATVWNFKTGTSKNPKDMVRDSVRGYLESENALERFGLPPSYFEPMPKRGYRKGQTKKGLPLKVDDGEELRKLNILPPTADVGDDDMTDEERRISDEREAEVLRKLEEMKNNPTPETQKISSPSDDQKKFNEWANARLITTIVTAELMTEGEKKALLHNLFPKFFTQI